MSEPLDYATAAWVKKNPDLARVLVETLSFVLVFVVAGLAAKKVITVVRTAYRVEYDDSGAQAA